MIVVILVIVSFRIANQIDNFQGSIDIRWWRSQRLFFGIVIFDLFLSEVVDMLENLLSEQRLFKSHWIQSFYRWIERVFVFHIGNLCRLLKNKRWLCEVYAATDHILYDIPETFSITKGKAEFSFEQMLDIVSIDWLDIFVTNPLS